MSETVWPHRRQPTRLPRPWDSPANNTGVGCHFLLQCMKVKSESEVTQLCPTLRNPMDCSLPGSSVHGIFQARVLEWGAIAFSILSMKPYQLDIIESQTCCCYHFVTQTGRFPETIKFLIFIQVIKTKPELPCLDSIPKPKQCWFHAYLISRIP